MACARDLMPLSTPNSGIEEDPKSRLIGKIFAHFRALLVIIGDILHPKPLDQEKPLPVESQDPTRCAEAS